MPSLDDVIMLLSILLSMCFMTLVARYIYREKCFESRKSWINYGIVFFLMETVAMFIPGEASQIIMVLVWVLAFSFMIVVTRKKRRIRGLLLFLPILGMAMSVDLIPIMAWLLISGETISDLLKDNTAYELSFEIAMFIGLLLWLKKTKAIRWTETELGTWEIRILNGNGILLLVINCIVVSIPELGTLFRDEQYIVAGGVLITVMIISSLIMMTVKSSNANYYKAMAEINERHLQSQLNHFKAYQDTQRETRRIEHDMKNHMTCISDLFNRGEYHRIGPYLQGLNDSIQNIDKELHIGNDMADAIINEKATMAKNYGIEIFTEGSMSGVNGIAPIDICTIFANALDNAIEALGEKKFVMPAIEISVKRGKKFLLISFFNSCDAKTCIVEKLIKTSKKDASNHGFGLQNIRMAAEKYKGSTQCRIVEREDENAQKLFCLEVMLMV